MATTAPRGRHRVVATGVERVAAQHPPDRQTDPTQRPVDGDRLQGVCTAGRVETAASRQRRAYPSTVRDNRQRNEAGTPARGHDGPLVASRTVRARAAASAASRSAASRWWSRSVTPGRARITTAAPGGSAASRSRMRCRSRRRTRLRSTAPPTAFGTTNPARAAAVAGWSVPAGTVRCTTTAPRAPRRPPRIVAMNSSRRRSREAASGRQAGATLGPAGRDDRATGARAHAQPETVGLRAPAVVRLVRALAHVWLRLRMLWAACALVTWLAHGGPATRARHRAPATLSGTAGRPPFGRSAEPRSPKPGSSRVRGWFRTGKTLVLWTAVERLRTTLLACPVAGKYCSLEISRWSTPSG